MTLGMPQPQQQTMTQEQQQKLQEMFQLMQMSRPQGTGQPQMPVLPSGQPAQPQMGPGGVVMPSGTAIPSVGNIPMSATPPRQPGGVSAKGIGMIPGMVMAIKQKGTQDKINKARALASQQIAMLQDPTMQQKLEQAAKSDPKIAQQLEKQKQEFAKVYDKAVADPDSPEGRGVQMAYRDSMQQEETKMKFEQLRAQIQAEQQRGQAEAARAAQAKALTPQNELQQKIAMGEELSASDKVKLKEVEEQIAARKEMQQSNLEFRNKQLDQEYELKKEGLEDKRLDMQTKQMMLSQMMQLRQAQVQSQIEYRSFMMEQKSKLPAVLIPRVEQAKMIDEMVDQLRADLKDPEIRQYVGVFAGQAKWATSRLNGKFGGFVTQLGSLTAMQAIIHGYRGGASMDKVFADVIRGVNQSPESLDSALEKISVLPKNFITDIRAQHPNDPIWEGYQIGAAGSSPDTAIVVK